MTKEQTINNIKWAEDKLLKHNDGLFYIASVLNFNDIDIKKSFTIDADDLANMFIECDMDDNGHTKEIAFEHYRDCFRMSFPVIQWTTINGDRLVVWNPSELDYTKTVKYLND